MIKLRHRLKEAGYWAKLYTAKGIKTFWRYIAYFISRGILKAFGTATCTPIIPQQPEKCSNANALDLGNKLLAVLSGTSQIKNNRPDIFGNDYFFSRDLYGFSN